MDWSKVVQDALPGLIVAAATAIVSAGVGAFLTVFWNTRQKQRELDLAAAEAFYRLYGEFFAVWKLWNYYRRDVGAHALPAASRWELLKRAADAEAGVEAILGQLAAQRDLGDDLISDLGKFRQGYQTLRTRIRDDRAIEWSDSEHPEYVAFKSLAASVAAVIQGGGGRRHRQATARANAWLRVTSNDWERNWAEGASGIELQRTKPAQAMEHRR